MKRTVYSWLFFSFQILFMLVVPLILIWVQYGDLEKHYKLSVTAIILTLAIFVIFKKIFLQKWQKNVEIKIANIETNALSLTDEKSIEANKKVWRLYSVLQLLFSAVVPILVAILFVITIKVVEQGLIKLFGVLMFSICSIFIGVIFRVAEIFSQKLYHEKE